MNLEPIASTSRSRRGPRIPLSAVVLIALPLLVLAIWEIVKVAGSMTRFKLPHVHDVFSQFGSETSQGQNYTLYLIENMGVTAYEAVIGFGIALFIGAFVAAVITYSPVIRKGVMPYFISLQTIPIIAFVPVILILLGPGLWTKVAITTYVSYFPILIFTARGFTAPTRDEIRLMRSFSSPVSRTFFSLRFPASLPLLFTGLRAAAGLSVVGAILAELPVGSNEGLGIVILNFAQYYASNPPALWAATAATLFMGMAFVGIIVVIESLVKVRFGGAWR